MNQLTSLSTIDQRIAKYRLWERSFTYFGIFFIGWGFGNASALGQQSPTTYFTLVIGGILVFCGRRLRQHADKIIAALNAGPDESERPVDPNLLAQQSVLSLISRL